MQLAIVAAGFTPGEADQLRRAMAAWKKKGGLEPFEKKLKEGMARNHYPAEFANQIFKQILGFGEYGFPESHSASFAQLAYFSAWLKFHHPAAFLAALLNSQPMGFYAPSQLIQDARRHGVEVRQADVSLSQWECTMEGGAVRLGLRMVGGLGAAAGERIAASRPCGAAVELAQRAGLGRKDLKSLADAGALQSLVGHRRDARWAAAGVESRPPMNVHVVERAPILVAPTEAEDIAADYGSLGFSLGRHPLALLRGRLEKLGSIDAQRLALLPHGRRVRTAGLVTCRQRPGTASGVVFVTMEDEFGFSNLVLWSRVFEENRHVATSSRLLMVHGRIERSDDSTQRARYNPPDPNAPQSVVYVIADRLERLDAQFPALDSMSRDFH